MTTAPPLSVPPVSQTASAILVNTGADLLPAPASPPDAAPSFSLDAKLVSDEFAQRIPIEFARDHLVLSQGVNDQGQELLIQSGRKNDALIAHNVSVRLGRPCLSTQHDPEAIAAAIEEFAVQHASTSAPGIESRAADDAAEWEELDEADIRSILEADERDLLNTAGRAPVVRLVNALVFEALQHSASDVHVQPAREAAIIRYRVDGILVHARTLPRKVLEPIVSRVKVMAHMDIAERRLPQDGRAAVTIGEKKIDLRISSIPTALGERLVIRLLDKRNTGMFDLERLGMPTALRERFEAICNRPHGMILVTGPTGSGKTTTLYAALRKFPAGELNIMTLEDPIEYELPGVSQSQINPRKGVTFGTGLRHILRQDPDVIMVGEIRDAETARIAIQSSLTGHLVFSTLHTNDAPSAVSRLIDLGIEPYLINASLAAVLAQRLVRTRCMACNEKTADTSPCSACGGSGFRGRLGLYEFLVMTDEIRTLVTRGAGVSEVRAFARAHGMQTLRESGLQAVALGRTTLAEVDRVIMDSDAGG